MPTTEWLEEIFNFSKTKSPGNGFEQAGIDGTRMIPLLGITFFYLLLLILTYMAYGVVVLANTRSKVSLYPTNNSKKKKSAIEWLNSKLKYMMVIRFCINNHFDFSIGCVLSV